MRRHIRVLVTGLLFVVMQSLGPTRVMAQTAGGAQASSSDGARPLPREVRYAEVLQDAAGVPLALDRAPVEDRWPDLSLNRAAAA